MGKTLYLHESRGLTVRADGPSLWVKERGRAGVRVPARRVDRVIISGNVPIDSGLLLLFAERSVPVTFLSLRGEPVATSVGLASPDEVLRDRQRLLGRSREGRIRAKSWLRAREHDFQLGLLRRFRPDLAASFRRCGFRSRDYRRVVEAFFADRSEAAARVGEIFHSLLFEAVLKSVTEQRFDCHCGILSRREDFGLVRDLLCILRPFVDDLTLRFLVSLRWMRGRRALGREVPFLYRKGGWKVSRTGRREMAERFEGRRERLGSVIGFLLEEYARMLREHFHEDKISCLL